MMQGEKHLGAMQKKEKAVFDTQGNNHEGNTAFSQ
jgi:hypothetical protein